MFISNEDKDYIFKTLLTLEERIEMILQRLEILEGWDKANTGTITVSSTDMKWGAKKDGTPRKKPGRKPAREVFNKGAKK